MSESMLSIIGNFKNVFLFVALLFHFFTMKLLFYSFTWSIYVMKLTLVSLYY